MRLINTTSLQMHDFLSDDVPKYAILSHTWGKAEEEVSFETFHNPNVQSLPGFSKIEHCCSIAKQNGLQYAWIDTCCIDKKSSAELSESINSMYRWYEEAWECYVYLADLTVSQVRTPRSQGDRIIQIEFSKARWFTRGWTLQELLASRKMYFYDRDWKIIGYKASGLNFRHNSDITSCISTATNIHRLHFGYPRKASIAQKMSWMAKR